MSRKNITKKINYSLQGFTLIELMVSLTLFIVVVGTGTGIFLSFYRSQRELQQVQDVLDNARLALERMTKTIRVSQIEPPNFSYSSSMGTSSLSMYHFRRGEDITYTIHNEDVVEIGDAGTFALTGEKIRVEDLRFYVQNVGKESGVYSQQPLVTIVLVVEPESEDFEGETISLQTSVSQRCLEDREDCHP